MLPFFADVSKAGALFPMQDSAANRAIVPSSLTVSADTPVGDAIARVNQSDTNVIFVVKPIEESAKRLVGVFAEQDVVELVASGVDWSEWTVESAMSEAPIQLRASEQNDPFATLKLFCQHQLRYLPVVGNRGELVGAISANELLDEIATEEYRETETSSRNESPLPHEQLQQELDYRQATETEIRRLNDKLKEQFIAHQLLVENWRTSEMQMRALFGQMTEIVIVVDDQLQEIRILPTNTALLYDPELDVLDQTVQHFFHSNQTQVFTQQIRSVLARQKTLNFEYSLTINETDIWFDACISPISDNLVLWIARDITQRKRAEMETLKALTQAQELNELKSRFVSMTSHEFRTPLAIIKSSTQLLQRYEWSKEERDAQLNQILSAVQHMLQLLNDVLTLGKAEAGKFDFNPVSLELTQFCENLIQEIQTSFDARDRVTFTANSPQENGLIEARMDEKLLRQILTNLLSNALKYSDRDSLVRFTLTVDSDIHSGEKRAIFQVEDRGIGIPPEEQSLLFESFHRAKNVGTIPGTGLGLPIVKKCVDLYGGTIACESRIGEGTTFEIVLPLY
ncbi:CBS domain-containing protein [Lusitaniella coriacea LEGE 07157]|uniref:histidine kinase n=1 Tax=Lusitaniella coriacea LEGE 07157 TaxID=945747 RepID=A0A8J7DVX7_9CYAN|nr:ATP-binding protein [Lusitaniella coriacea]MBE9116077.1 CBS domain-containing protein [Lusitaniella coriacea LEGE 07157]